MKVLSSLRVEVLVKIFLIHLSTESSAAAEVAGTSLVATIIDSCLRSRPGSPDVVRLFVHCNVENSYDSMTV